MTDSPTSGKSLTYRQAGVNIDAGNELVRRIAPLAARTRRPEIISGIGGFAALARVPERYRQPLLVTGTDGVGTKLRMAVELDRHDHIGQDLVAMAVNDVLVVGAEPLLFLDYLAVGQLNVEIAERIISGIASACLATGCTLAGGETAEMPDMYRQGDYDLAGFCLAVVEADAVIDGSRIRPGDAIIGLASSGPHSNGFSLIRRILGERDSPPPPALMDALMAPTRLYVRPILDLLNQVPVHGMAHITGGGLPENLPRVLPTDCAAAIDLLSWTWPDCFTALQQAGQIAESEMLRTFNCGVGFVVIVPPAEADRTLEALRGAGERAWQMGTVVPPNAAPDGRLMVPGKHQR